MKRYLSILILFFAVSAEASIQLSPYYIDFGDRSIDYPYSARRSIHVRNTSNQRLSINVNHSCFGELRVSNSCFSLMPYGSCWLDVEFNPSREGYFSCRVNVHAIGGGFASTSISGRGVSDRNAEANEPIVFE